MKSLLSAKFVPVMAMAFFSFSLMSFATAVSAQAPGVPGASGLHVGGPHKRATQMYNHHKLRRAERLKRLFDTDADGKVTLDEINTDQARMFTALDVDGDKHMSVAEIMRRGRLLQIYRTTTLFDLLDADGNGKLSIAEVQAPTKRWFKRYDVNGDGVMTGDEIPKTRRRDRRHGRVRR